MVGVAALEASLTEVRDNVGPMQQRIVHAETKTLQHAEAIQMLTTQGREAHRGARQASRLNPTAAFNGGCGDAGCSDIDCQTVNPYAIGAPPGVPQQPGDGQGSGDGGAILRAVIGGDGI